MRQKQVMRPPAFILPPSVAQFLILPHFLPLKEGSSGITKSKLMLGQLHHVDGDAPISCVFKAEFQPLIHTINILPSWWGEISEIKILMQTGLSLRS